MSDSAFADWETRVAAVWKIADTLTPQELAVHDARELLRRLYSADDIRIFDPRPVFALARGCANVRHCPRSRVIIGPPGFGRPL